MDIRILYKLYYGVERYLYLTFYSIKKYIKQTLKVKIFKKKKDINLQDSNGWTPVHSASYHGVI
jgi:ankyrin repeat protein